MREHMYQTGEAAADVLLSIVNSASSCVVDLAFASHIGSHNALRLAQVLSYLAAEQRLLMWMAPAAQVRF